MLERSAFQHLQMGQLLNWTMHRVNYYQNIHQKSSKDLCCLGLAYKGDFGEFSDYDGEKYPSHMKLFEPTNYFDIESNLIL